MAERKIYKAISNVMKDVGAVSKDSENSFDHYKFRGIEAVMNALSPAMVKNNVFVTPEVLEQTREERQNAKGGMMMYTILKVKYTFYTDDGSSIETVVIGEAMDRSDKSTNKAMSAAFKYACFQTFCIPTEEMKDADQESPEIGNKVPAKQKAPQQTAQQAVPQQTQQEEEPPIDPKYQKPGATPEQLRQIENLVTEYSKVCGHKNNEIYEVLKKTVKFEKIGDITKEQGDKAISILTSWIRKTKEAKAS